MREPSDGLAALPPVGRWRREARVGLLILADLTAHLVAWTLAYVAWARPVRDQAPGLYLTLLPLLLFFPVGYAQAGLYPDVGLAPAERLRRLSYVTVSVYLLLAASVFALKIPDRYSRITFGLALLASLPLVPFSRGAVQRFARSWWWWPEPTLAIGSTAAISHLVRDLARGEGHGYELVGALALAADQSGTATHRLPIVGTLDDGPAIVSRGYRIALLATEGQVDVRLLDQAQQIFPEVLVARGRASLPVEGLRIRTLGPIVGVEYRNNLLRRRNRILKRTADLVLGSALFLAALPLIGLAAAAVRLVSPGPPFYRQRRIGFRGVPLDLPKVRTMRADAETQLGDELERRPELRAEWEASLKLRRDPRLVPVLGRLLRRYSIDELPQLWSVVRGEMSLVGPRPFPDYHLARFDPEFRQLRHRVLPGLTGLWQVLVRSEGSVEDQVALDSYYIRNWSLWLDAWILARTIGAVLAGRGAY